MKAKQTEDARGFLKCTRPRRWTALLGVLDVGLAALSGTLIPTLIQAAAPVSLTLRGEWPVGQTRDVAVQGQYAYVAYGWDGFQVIDVSNPANPARVALDRATGEERWKYLAPGGINAWPAVAADTIVWPVGLGTIPQLIALRISLWLDVLNARPLTLAITGLERSLVRVQRSSNLLDWEYWQTVTLGDAPAELSDPDAATTTARFFRAIQP